MFVLLMKFKLDLEELEDTSGVLNRKVGYFLDGRFIGKWFEPRGISYWFNCHDLPGEDSL